MLRRTISFICLMIIISGFSEKAVSLDKNSQDDNYKFNSSTYSTSTESIAIPEIQWPLSIGVQRTGKINASFNDQGQFGTGFSDFNSTPSISFETPSYSGLEYLFGGLIWVGAIVGNDTLVSTGADGWQGGYEEFGADNTFDPNLEKLQFPSDYSMRAEFTDTVIDGIQLDFSRGTPHIPLNVKIANRSHIWRVDTLDNAIFYDLLITNIGDQTLEQAYIGFYFDCDVGHTSMSGYERASDDLSGSLRDNGIAYIIDNDGDPSAGSFNSTSPTKAFAFKLLASSFPVIDTNYNWWVSGTSDDTDFGPRLRGIPEDPFRDFGTGFIGTPMGDANKYYIMSHKEWDYDQYDIATIGSSDPDWMEPNPSGVTSLAVGVDSRFLYSFGPFDLAPGQSERIIFSTFTADSIHQDPTNLDNLPHNPTAYKANLNLDNIASIGSAIIQAVDSILNPLIQPAWLEIFDYNKISFDPYVFDDVTGYNVYATSVDASAFTFPGAIPPWYKPTSPFYVGSSIDSVSVDTPDGLTAVNVSYTSVFGESELSQSAFINMPAAVTPTIREYSTTTTESSVLLSWYIPDTVLQPDHFNIYKFASYDDFKQVYSKPYYNEGSPNNFTTDSIEVDGTWWFYQSTIDTPYTVVDGNEREFIENNFDEEFIYIIVSVDQFGFESGYATTTTYLMPERTKDLLIIINSEVATLSTSANLIIDYYNALLQGSGISYEFFSVLDSSSAAACPSVSYCPTWQFMSAYDYVLIDETEYADQYWKYEILSFITNGGKLINFGALSEFNYNNHSTTPGWYDNNFLNKTMFGVDSIFNMGHLYNYPNPIEENRFGFNVARSEGGLFADLQCDTVRFPLDPKWQIIVNDNPTNEPLHVTTFMPSENSVVTHRYNSLYPATSYMENMAVGLKHVFSDGFDSTEVYTYGFHLYYMHLNQSRDLLGTILGVVIDTTFTCCIPPIRGNVDSDLSEQIDISDLVYLVDFIFTNGPQSVCNQEANIDGDIGEHIDISDLVYLVDFIFTGGPPPPGCF